MIDYPALRALASVVRTGSFEKAASRLGVTPSAVSQRVKQLEERLGTVLVARGQPCTATEAGEWLCRHAEQVGLLEEALFRHLPALGEGAGAGRVTVPIATSADSLGTWFLPAIAPFLARSDLLLDIAVDDQDHTADWLRRGQVLAAVTGLGRPVQGCRTVALGALRYRATASPAFAARHFTGGVTPEALARAPTLTYNQKDLLQTRWIERTFGMSIAAPTHWLPSTQGFVEACRLGLGWALNPVALADPLIASGALVELVPDSGVDVPLYWQVNRLAADRLEGLTRGIVSAARDSLVPA
ncbi:MULTISPECIES: LysR family transcriptional regulator ArgP [unclassified Aureimonas]|uniref:LysR family transcriptional regulator ArgP n=1 Tax=unclassified Aureimonas TaxID=2615206 RepID=UPI0006FD44DA|nr:MULTISPECIES: LysR family transcriptional regulator ArgP [unclassified Aureimonas]KQT68903.1 LysR family transcriptional regulator [Aureimonas sp. Leaf460]KQT69130.1 LysR family transcriptional regulator [Aureimonas sp. Leaf427]